ncbi:MAG TPA: DedA family protein [Myxococcaceae bacterium]|nr:DedA family protein [Myxococcaceae bacterium]
MVTYLLHRFTYLGMFGLLVAAGLGIPIPEDVTLLTGGYLARQGITSLWPTLIVAYAGVVIGDLLIFRLGGKLREGIYTHQRLGKLFTARRRAWIEEHFRKRGVLTVVIGRHAAGLRAPTFLVAGASGMPTWKFLLADGFSAMLTVPVVTYLGYLFADNLEKAKDHVHQIELWALAGLVAVGLAIFAYHFIQRRRGQRREVDEHRTVRTADQSGSVRSS